MSPLLKNLFALSYLFIIYGAGIYFLIGQSWMLNLLGVLLIIHALLLATAFVHEFIHGNIFKQKTLNAFWGKIMTHLNGACYATWDDLVDHHLKHHIYHVDFIPFDYPKFIQQLHPVACHLLIGLEWAYFPAFEFILRWHVISAPFRDPKRFHLRGRTLWLMAYRVALFGLLTWISWKALLLYGVAYVGFVLVMRFVDTFHHTYEYAIVGEAVPKYDRVYEQANTLSNVVSIRYPWLNLLYLNFGYHNAHHHNMHCPWHELPQLHKNLYGEQQLAPFGQLISNYHRFRLVRLTSGQGDTLANGSLADFPGAVGVSFLTPP